MIIDYSKSHHILSHICEEQNKSVILGERDFHYVLAIYSSEANVRPQICLG